MFNSFLTFDANKYTPTILKSAIKNIIESERSMTEFTLKLDPKITNKQKIILNRLKESNYFSEDGNSLGHV